MSNELTPATGFANVDVSGVLANLSNSLVKVVHGAADGHHPVANSTVATVRNTFAGAYNIPSDAVALVNGQRVAEDYVLNSNETLEFIKQAGVKG